MYCVVIKYHVITFWAESDWIWAEMAVLLGLKWFFYLGWNVIGISSGLKWFQLDEILGRNVAHF
jgi:hypothetical protein